ncbi:MAG: oligosaccharide flippase family protein, partial [bacterium]
LNAALVQGVAQGHEGLLKKSWSAKLKWSLLGSLAAVIIAVYFWQTGNPLFAFSLLIIAICLPFFNSAEIYRYYLDGKKLFGQRVIYTTIIQLLSALAVIITIFFTNNLIYLIAAYFLSYSLLRIFFLFYVIYKTKPNRQNDEKTLTYGKHLSLMSILSVVALQIDKILLFAFLGPAPLAVYSFAVLPVQYLIIPFQHIRELALPKLSVQTESEIKKTLPKKIIKSLLPVLLIIIIYIIVVPYFFQIFYPQYSSSVNYSKVYSLILLGFPVSLMALVLQAKMKTKALYKINIIDPAIKIALMAILIPIYGIWGLIIAILISQFIYFLLVIFYFKKMRITPTAS